MVQMVGMRERDVRMMHAVPKTMVTASLGGLQEGHELSRGNHHVHFFSVCGAECQARNRPFTINLRFILLGLPFVASRLGYSANKFGAMAKNCVLFS